MATCSPSSRPSQGGDGLAVRVGHLSTLYHTSFLLMGSPGLERDLGTPCDWRLFGTGPEMVRAFERGELDVGYIGLPPAIIGIARGVPITCIAAGHVEGTVMVSKTPVSVVPVDEGGIRDVLEGYRGRTIGTTSKGSIHDVILSRYLRDAGLHDQVTVARYDQAELIAIALHDGGVAAGVGTPALHAFARTLGPVDLVIPPAVFWPGNPSYGVFVHERFSREEPGAVEAFLRHHALATRFLKDDPLGAATQIAGVVPVAPVAYVEEVLRVSPRYLAEITPAFVDATISFARELRALGYIDRVPGPPEIFSFTT